MSALVAILTFALPFLVLPWIEDPWNEPKELLWLLGCWGVILLGLFRQRLLWTPWNNRWTAPAAGWVLLTGAYHFFWTYLTRPKGLEHITIAQYQIHHWMPVVSVLTAVLTIRVLAAWLSVPLAIYRVTTWICLTSLAVALYAIAQGFGVDQFFRANYAIASPGYPMGVGFGNAATTSMYLALTLPLFFLFKGWRWMLGLLVVLGVILYLPYRSSWLVAGTGLVTYGACRAWARLHNPLARAAWSVLLLVGLAGGLFVVRGVMLTDERMPVWEHTVASWRTSKSSWSGQGLQSFPELAMTKQAMALGQSSYWPTPFNEWVGTLYELGIIGVLLLGVTVWSSLRRGWSMAVTLIGAGWFASAMATLVCSVIFFPWHYAPTAWITMVIVAMLERTPEGV